MALDFKSFFGKIRVKNATSSTKQLDLQVDATATAGTTTTISAKQTADRSIDLPNTSGTLTIAPAPLDPTAVVTTDASGFLISTSGISTTELQALEGITSNVQTQLGGKASTDLSNLVTTSINQDLIPNGTKNLGTALAPWEIIYFNGSLENATAPILLAGSDSVRRAKQASKTNYIEEHYEHGVALLASQTDTVIASLTFAFATNDAVEITYKVKQATTGFVRLGTIRVVCDGTNVALVDTHSESGILGLSFSAAINGANVEIRYTSNANAATLNCDIKKFLT